LGTKEVWELALSIEQSEMSLKNVRERTSLIARLGRMLENTSVDEITLNMVITYLLSQLKVNFRPLYAETVNVLGEIAKTHGEPIWTLVWQELEKTLAAEHASCPDLGSSLPPWAEKSSDSAPEDSPAQEEDEYYCPGMTKTRKVIKSAWVANRGDSTAKEVTVSCCPRGE
jgi:U3 small nucleolar RNA-associated protein 20